MLDSRLNSFLKIYSRRVCRLPLRDAEANCEDSGRVLLYCVPGKRYRESADILRSFQLLKRENLNCSHFPHEFLT